MADRNSRVWGVLLAGGDGARLRSLTATIEGDARPKQFCRILSDESMLTSALRRVSPRFEADQTVVVVTRKHEPFYASQLGHLPQGAVFVQPDNRGTGIAIAAAILFLQEQDPDAVVAFFPCDHHFGNEAAFLNAVEAGIHAAEDNADMIVLLGAAPTRPETEYGWIEPEQPVAPGSGLVPVRVRRFWEKPNAPTARELLRMGCLWNTFVTMGRVSAFIEILCAAFPEVILALAAGTMARDLSAPYRSIPIVDFCRDVLACQPERLLVIRDGASRWSDLGSPERVFDTLTRENLAPPWLRPIRKGAGKPSPNNHRASEQATA